MLCEECKMREANTHIKKIINGKKQEYNLCSECAAGLGYDNMLETFIPDMNSLLGGLFTSAVQSPLASLRRCPVCGGSYNDIVKTGTVGCAQCYKTFYKELLPSIKRIHGNTIHNGKSFNVSGQEKSSDELNTLKNELSKAIQQQEFERAAQLRDRIKALEENK